MKLTHDIIKSLTVGAVDHEIKDGALRPLRYTERERQLYLDLRGGYHEQLIASAGIKLRFMTDSSTLTLRLAPEKATSRNYFSSDIFCDGEYIGSIDNFSHMEIPASYSGMVCPEIEAKGSFILKKDGEARDKQKEVCIHLPWSRSGDIEELSLEDGAVVTPVKRERTALFYGDSITHGYDALRPSSRYTAILADLLGAEEYNKAYGADFCFNELMSEDTALDPDYVFISYGTNDWWSHTSEGFERRYLESLKGLRRNYPRAKIFAITPIWRKEMNDEKKFGPFASVETIIKAKAEEVNGSNPSSPSIRVICGGELLPPDETLYGDLRLHPNDRGFMLYAENVFKKVREAL